ncbi:MAG: TraR/DksA C4-type zinc finger protein [Magnetococcales bacterium]|nr:TraR/DksA C4-type zinc finger protein [Magnetococcales bacterium]
MSDELDLDLEQMKQRLIARRKELMALSNSSKEARDSVELDQTRVGRLSRMDAMQMQAMSQENERRRQMELQRINVALRRVDEEEYGYCIRCDEPIAIKRLELDPSLLNCITCAQKSENSP